MILKNSLPIARARRVILDSQRLTTRRSFGKGPGATLKAVEHLGYVQIDTLSVVSRAHLHTLWNRVEVFSPSHIDQLQQERKIFEHWAHALAYLPMTDYRFSLPMMNRIASGAVHWYPKNPKETRKVLKRIREEGPLSSKDFSDKKSSNDMWARSASKLALEHLFMEGKLMIHQRRNFHKVYDLRERVLPDHIDTRTPDEDSLSRHLIVSYLRAHGFGQIKEAAYLRKGMGSTMGRVAAQMEEEKLIIPIKIADWEYYCLPETIERTEQIASRGKLRILSPFDNAVIQRKRIKQLFDFDYQIECYVRKDLRKYGYFSLPILFNNKLVARLDAKADRKERVFHLLHLHLEPSLKNVESFLKSLPSELNNFASFNDCDRLQLHRISGSTVKPDWG